MKKKSKYRYYKNLTSSECLVIYLGYVVSTSLYTLLIWKMSDLNSKCFFNALIMFSFISIASFLVISRKKLSNRFSISFKNAFIVISAASGSSFFLFLGGLLFLNILYPHDHIDESYWFYVRHQLIVIWLSGLCLLPPKSSWNIIFWSVGMGVFVTIFLSVVYRMGGKETALIMQAFKLGSMQEATLIVDDVGCQTLLKQDFPINCQFSGAHVANKINILWRVGEYYISYKVNNTEKKIIIPASHVLSFSTK